MKKIPFWRGSLLFSLALAGPAADLRGELASYYDHPDTVFASNTVIDIIPHGGGVWFATGEGVNFSLDSGRTWLLYNRNNGLVSDNISVLFSQGGRLWAGTNHDVIVNDEIQTYSDGLSYTDDNGNTWTHVDFQGRGLWGVFRTVYDMTGHYDPSDPYGSGNWLFFSAFAGGLMASRDGGTTWRRIFASTTDSLNYASGSLLNYTNRYFSCAADTSHGDSLFLWAGTAGGLLQYVYALPREKAYADKRVQRIAFNDDVLGPDDNYVYYAGDLGVTRGTKTGGPYISRFAVGDDRGPGDGLPGPYISTIYVFRRVVFVGTMDSAGGASTGLAVSHDLGDTYQAQTAFTEVIGAGRKVSDFARVRDRLYMAGEEAGLFVSGDTGLTWSHIFVDSTDTAPANRRNVVHALCSRGDTLRVGTDSGLVTLYLDSAGLIDSSWNFVFAESDSSSTQVVRIKVEEFLDPADSSFDSLCVWTINWPLTALGEHCVRRSIGDQDRDFMSSPSQPGVVSYDINFFSDSVFVATTAGVHFSKNGENGVRNQTFIHEIKDTRKSPTDRIDHNVTVFEVLGDTIFAGCDSGFAVSYDRGKNYRITRINRDTLASDFVVNFTRAITRDRITGDFLPAVAVQYVDGERARVWTSNRPNNETSGGSAGISLGVVVPLIDTATSDTVGWGREWVRAYDGGFAWNFAFNGDSIFAATDVGLLVNYEQLGAAWDTIALVNNEGVTLVQPGVPVYAVEVIGRDLWIGTDDRTVRLRLSNFRDAQTFYVIDSTTAPDVVYAYPAPFSFSADDWVDFHFVVERDAYITLEIYDFAMNLVARVVDNQFYPRNTYPTIGSHRPVWNGHNGKGDEVAVGMYHFKIEYSTGEVRWGKLAVIP